MGEISKKLKDYHKIYEQVYENPSIPLYQITKNTGISRSTASRYLQEMYKMSIMKGPFIFVRPAQNYRLYVAFLEFEHPVPTYLGFHGFPDVIHRSLSLGSWNVLLICEKLMNFSVSKGFKQCIHQGAKSVTCLSKVTSIDWDHSIKRMYSVISPPKQKSTLYEEIPHIPWNNKEWTLYHKFRHNTRSRVMPVLRESKIRFVQYQKWLSELPQFAHVQPAFYPYGLDSYFVIDFLFQSEYHKELTHILGMLPSTSVFFSVGEHLLARVSLLNKPQQNELVSLIFHLGENGYYKTFHSAQVVSTSEAATSKRR
ncbi:MAG: winged helix-turn-helix domain-containing protein [Theionarchaea archaeon]|nr:winged helix-turn-helix domain-containing protein [Theionarchaea archaeon]